MSRPPIRIHAVRAAFLLGVLPAWCIGLFVARLLRAGMLSYGYLVWNLVLAMAPAFASLMLVRADRERASTLELLGWGAVWLLFLPNAPYLVTDLVHLSQRPPVPWWFDVAMLVSFACTGLLLCYGSVADVHAVVARRRGIAAGWTLALSAMLLSGLGIYLGRFLRWNSWFTLTRPRALLDQVAAALAEPASGLPGLRVTLVYGVGLAIGYAAIHLVLPDDMPRRKGE